MQVFNGAVPQRILWGILRGILQGILRGILQGILQGDPPGGFLGGSWGFLGVMGGFLGVFSGFYIREHTQIQSKSHPNSTQIPPKYGGTQYTAYCEPAHSAYAIADARLEKVKYRDADPR